MRLPRDHRTWCLTVAALLLGLGFALPRIERERERFDLLAVIDITGSMNTRDITLDGHPVSRLEAVKRAIGKLARALPCRSRLGLAVFSARQPFLLFAPLDVCRNFDALEAAISAIDWRMAWAGDSHIADGLYAGLSLAGSLNSALLFLTDGQEAPPLPWTGGPHFDGKRGAVPGLIVGVGGYTPVPIPKFDNQGRQVGFYAMTDVVQENTNAPPPPGAEKRKGYHPRNAPFGDTMHGTEHLSSVRESYLKGLAADTGIAYAHFTEQGNLMSILARAGLARTGPVAVDIRPIPAGLALILLVAAHFPFTALRGLRRSRRHNIRRTA